ncbi:MAG: hypothetical protein LBN40_02695 [Oscillospiraceae bacterium]|jgi:hypothetical protein|nr:hypothetical protein [Oscillospiraceae bacterium]
MYRGKGLGFVIVGIIALLGAAVCAIILLKRKFENDDDIDWDEVDELSDENFDDLFGTIDEEDDDVSDSDSDTKE